MKRITDFRFLLVLGLLTSAAFGLSFRASSEADSTKVVATYFVSGVVAGEEEQEYQITNTTPTNCGPAPAANVCQISTSATPDGNNRIPVSQATPSAWKP